MTNALTSKGHLGRTLTVMMMTTTMMMMMEQLIFAEYVELSKVLDIRHL